MDSGSRLSRILQLTGFSAPEKAFAEMVCCDCLPRFSQQHHVNWLSFGNRSASRSLTFRSSQLVRVQRVSATPPADLTTA
jgi:hypothetical protein